MSSEPLRVPSLQAPVSLHLSEPPLSPPLSGSMSTPAPPPVVPIAPAAPLRTAPLAAPPVDRPEPGLETLLLRFGLLSSDQMAAAMAEEARTGKDVATIVVEQGWVSADDLAKLRNGGAPVAPAPVAVAPPAVVPAPVAEPSLTEVPELPIVPVPEPSVAELVEPSVETLPPRPVLEAEPIPAPVVELPAPEPVLEPAAILETPAPAAAPQLADPVESAAPQERHRVLVHLSNGELVQAAQAPDVETAKQLAGEIIGRLAGGEWPCFNGRFVRPDAVVSVDVAAAPN